MLVIATARREFRRAAEEQVLVFRTRKVYPGRKRQELSNVGRMCKTNRRDVQ